MIPLIIFIAMALTILVLFEVRARREAKLTQENGQPTIPVVPTDDSGCCGQHLVCERETLLQTNAEIIYYDDEELDALIGIDPEDYTTEQADQIREVFHTMQEKDVSGWVRSMQLRNIQLPDDVRQEALLIVMERRRKI